MTRPLPLRAEQPPDDATVVLRAGLMTVDNVNRSAQRTFDAYAVYGLSVEGVIDQSVLDACRTSARIASYRQIRLSTFGRLRAAGFALLATFDIRTSQSCCPISASSPSPDSVRASTPRSPTPLGLPNGNLHPTRSTA